MPGNRGDRDHLVPLPGGDWSLWQWSALRGAGFPASMVLRLATPDAAAAADRLFAAEEASAGARTAAIAAIRRERDLPSNAEARDALQKAGTLVWKGRVPPCTGTAADAEIGQFRVMTERAGAAHEEFSRAIATGLIGTYRAAQELAADPQIREAVTWQNRGALEAGFASLLRCDPAKLRSKDRKDVALVGIYLQRYCTKNDTIGFFGPVGWARLSSDGEPMVAHPAENPLAARGVYFEQWGIDALADKLSKDERMAPWMAPRRMPFIRVDGTSVHSAVNGKHTLTEEQALVLAACGGVRTARDVATGLVAAHPQALPTEDDVFEILRVLREKKLLAWSFEVPLIWKPEQALRTLIQRITDEALRAEASGPLEELEAGRQKIARSAGDAQGLCDAFNELEATFTKLTGAAPTRHAGSMYAARLLVFEDCRRGFDLTIGPQILEALGPALSLVLASARWFTFEAGKAYREAFRAIYSDLARKSERVRLSDLWYRAQRVLFGAKERPLDAVVATLEARWAQILVAAPDARAVRFDSADLRSRVLEAFDAPRPGWRCARHHSPDVMIAADSVDAIRRGDYTLVLGEIHAGLNSLNAEVFHSQHPQPEDLRQAFDNDFPEPLIMPVMSKDWPKVTVRSDRAFVPPSSFALESGFDLSGRTRDRVLALGDLVIEELEGELVVPVGDEPPIPLIEFFASTITQIVMPSFRILPRSAHSPRVTIDQLVVCREAWTFPSSEMAFAYETEEGPRFLAARRWARAHGLPRFVFAKSPVEVKPLFVDFDSPLFVGMLARIARAAKEHVAGETPLTITEMLPGLDQAWLPDAAGERYTSELRIVAVDSAR
jgi:hypothetical protein